MVKRMKLLIGVICLMVSAHSLVPASGKGKRPGAKKTVRPETQEQRDLRRAFQASRQDQEQERRWEDQAERDLLKALELSQELEEEEKSLRQALAESLQANRANKGSALQEPQLKRPQSKIKSSTGKKPGMAKPEPRGAIKKSVKKTASGYVSAYARKMPVEQQENAECGYHAVINTVRAVATMTGRELPTLSLANLKKAIQKRRQRKGGIGDQWLDTEEVEFLAKDVYELPNYEFTVIGDITGPLSRRFLSESVIDAIEMLQKSDGTVHGFIVGNMRQEQAEGAALQAVQKKSNFGHWISVVARREGGHIHYDVRNSLSSPAAPTVNALIQLVESNPAELWLQSESLISEKLNDVERALELGLYSDMLKAIAAIVARAEHVPAEKRGNFYRPNDLRYRLELIPDNALDDKEQVALKEELIQTLQEESWQALPVHIVG